MLMRGVGAAEVVATFVILRPAKCEKVVVTGVDIELNMDSEV